MWLHSLLALRSSSGGVFLVFSQHCIAAKNTGHIHGKARQSSMHVCLHMADLSFLCSSDSLQLHFLHANLYMTRQSPFPLFRHTTQSSLSHILYLNVEYCMKYPDISKMVNHWRCPFGRNRFKCRHYNLSLVVENYNLNCWATYLHQYESKPSLAFSYVTLFYFLTVKHTLLDSANHFLIASHLLGQCFLAPSSVPHFVWASLSDSFFGMGLSLKKLSCEANFFLNFSTACAVSDLFVICLAISSTWNQARVTKEICFLSD